MSRVFVEFDLAGAEWVIVAFLAQDPAMKGVFRSGKSPHVATACMMFGAAEEEVIAEEAALDGCTNKEEIENWRLSNMPSLLAPDRYTPKTRTMRQGAKICNHSFNYGLGYRSFGLRYSIPEPDAKRLHDLYHETAYPGVRRVFWKYINECLSNGGYLETCFGIRRDFYGLVDQKLNLEARAHIPQSTVMSITRLGMLHVFENEPDADLCMQIHDSIVCSCPANAAYLAGFIDRVCKAMSPVLSYGGDEFTLGVDVKIGVTKNKKRMYKGTSSVDVCQSALDKLAIEFSHDKAACDPTIQ